MQVKEWFRVLAIDINLNNCQTKDTLMCRVAQLADEVAELPDSEAAARQGITSLSIAAAAPQLVAPHFMQQQQGVPLSLASALPLGLGSSGFLPVANVWQQ